MNDARSIGTRDIDPIAQDVLKAAPQQLSNPSIFLAVAVFFWQRHCFPSNSDVFLEIILLF